MKHHLKRRAYEYSSNGDIVLTIPQIPQPPSAPIVNPIPLPTLLLYRFAPPPSDKQNCEVGPNTNLGMPVTSLGKGYHFHNLPVVQEPLYNVYAQTQRIPSTGMIERLGPQVLRKNTSSIQHKTIPNDEAVNLELWELKNVNFWTNNETIGFIVSTAKRKGIPVEELNIHHFTDLSGKALCAMDLAEFSRRDATYGPTIYESLQALRRKFGHVTPPEVQVNSVLLPPTQGCGAFDKLRATESHCNQHPSCSTTLTTPPDCTVSSSNSSSHNSPQEMELAAEDLPSESVNVHLSPEVITVKAPSRSPSPSSSKASLQHERISSAPVEESCAKQQPIDRDTPTSSYEQPAVIEIKRRRRAPHLKGSKLWEFIRDTLRDPETCPSVVRWENEEEGIFRIVESEKLARMWGAKKNNARMTYEKLSRAMRTYYEKGLLQPAPRNGKYPKKLVYQFGPRAVLHPSAQSSTSNEPPMGTLSWTLVDKDSPEPESPELMPSIQSPPEPLQSGSPDTDPYDFASESENS